MKLNCYDDIKYVKSNEFSLVKHWCVTNYIENKITKYDDTN